MRIRKKNLLERLGSGFRFDLYRRLVPYLRPYWLPASGVVVILVLQSGFGLLDPWPMAILIDSGLSGRQLPAWLKAAAPSLSGQPRSAIVVAAILGGLVMWLVGNVIGIMGDR